MGSIQDIENYAEIHDVPIMMKDGIAFLIDQIKNNEIYTILELGTAIGYSAIRMAEVKDNIVIDTLEIDEERIQEALKNIENHHLSNRITVHHSDAMAFETDTMYDLIFIDAAKAQYGKYMRHFEKNLKTGGTFVFDNLNFHGMVDNPELTKNRNTKHLVRKIKVFRDELLVNENYATIFYSNIGDGVAIAVKK